MLEEIRIKDFAVIGEVALALKPGLNIITGETGAGKSMIIESINLLVGGRADTGRIRHGAEAADISGLFVLGDGREFALRRLVTREGKSRAYVNGVVVTTGELSGLGGTLLDIHGQHEHQTLLRPQNHLEIIDRVGGVGLADIKKTYQGLLKRYRDRLKALRELETAAADLHDRQELLAWQIKELTQ